MRFTRMNMDVTHNNYIERKKANCKRLHSAIMIYKYITSL